MSANFPVATSDTLAVTRMADGRFYDHPADQVFVRETGAEELYGAIITAGVPNHPRYLFAGVFNSLIDGQIDKALFLVSKTTEYCPLERAEEYYWIMGTGLREGADPAHLSQFEDFLRANGILDATALIVTSPDKYYGDEEPVWAWDEVISKMPGDMAADFKTMSKKVAKSMLKLMLLLST